MASKSELQDQENPWASNDLLLGVNLGDPRSGLVVARRCGLLGGAERGQRQGRGQEERVAQCSSVQMIHAMQEMTKLNKQIHQIEFELHKHRLDKESKDLMHLDVLEKRLQSVDTLLSHFTAVLGSKEQLLTRLQSCSTENSLHVEAPYHKHLFDILHSINPTLTDLTSSTSHIEWARSLDLSQSPMEGKMGTAVQSLVECRDMYHNCQHLHSHHHSTSKTL